MVERYCHGIALNGGSRALGSMPQTAFEGMIGLLPNIVLVAELY